MIAATCILIGFTLGLLGTVWVLRPEIERRDERIRELRERNRKLSHQSYEIATKLERAEREIGALRSSLALALRAEDDSPVRASR